MANTILSLGPSPTREQQVLRVCFVAVVSSVLLCLVATVIYLLPVLGGVRPLSYSYLKLFEDIYMTMLVPVWGVCLWAFSVRSRTKKNDTERTASNLGLSD